MEKKDEFRIAEFNALRAQLLDRVKAIEAAGMTGAGISGAFWAWVLSAESLPQVPAIFFFIPAILVVILTLRLFTLDRQRIRLANYLAKVERQFEVEGWEVSFADKSRGFKHFLMSVRLQQVLVLATVLLANIVGAFYKMS